MYRNMVPIFANPGDIGRNTEAVVATKYLCAVPPGFFFTFHRFWRPGRNAEAVVATKYLCTIPPDF